MEKYEQDMTEAQRVFDTEYSSGEYCHEQSFLWGFQEGADYKEKELLSRVYKWLESHDNGYLLVDKLRKDFEDYMKVEEIGDGILVEYFGKTYKGIYDSESGWNFWEITTNDLANEEESYTGDIHNLEELEAFFKDNVY